MADDEARALAIGWLDFGYFTLFGSFAIFGCLSLFGSFTFLDLGLFATFDHRAFLAE